MVLALGTLGGDEIGALITETPEAPSPLAPCEDSAGRWSSVHQELSPHQTLNLLAT